ncbi:hypothetical protein THAOC_00812 [Thalassiosira oceanica]|uniref:RING-type domain-containing protein n=1 Tax=Thalassiosira oceanica TaxID=159749 RepID=K0TIF3_THAOC|nr:hypothetical protein THAOC_00812 [Thalassiosira oceanica]|eukprot:EJK77360.1 hypothetical protein THAOC_00812 [Thalassiosira oceanica]
MAENSVGAAAVVTENTCGICLEDPKDPLNLPCGHSFCDKCLDGWRSRYGVEEEIGRKCPICRAMIPPSKEMVTTLLYYRAHKQTHEDKGDTSSEGYYSTCRLLRKAEQKVGADWDGVTVLEDGNGKQTLVMPDYVITAIRRGDSKKVLKWINANRAEDRVNAKATDEMLGMSALMMASLHNNLALMTQLLQLGANVEGRTSFGGTAISSIFNDNAIGRDDISDRARLLLSWGASFFPGHNSSLEASIHQARKYGKHEIANLLESELGGRRCEIVNLSARPELNGKTCVADEYLPASNQYKVTLETKSSEVLVLEPDNLKRRDRTLEDCGYYIEFKNGRTIRHDFDSSEDCKAFVAALNKGESLPVVTEEAEARAEQRPSCWPNWASILPETIRSRKPRRRKEANKKEEMSTEDTCCCFGQ